MRSCDICRSIINSKGSTLCATCRDTVARLKTICSKYPQLIGACNDHAPPAMPVGIAVAATPSR